MTEKTYKFVIMGRPKVQKNDLKIYGGRGSRMFVGHSKELTKIREALCDEAYSQYVAQGGVAPIDYLVEVSFKFYHGRQWEPDLDNLPSIVFDAIQGRKVGKKKDEKVVINAILSNDKLVRFQQEEKIIEGDEKYYGEPRTEFEIRRYNPNRGDGQTL